MADEPEPQTPEAFWEDFYASGRSRWSGDPNASLVEEVAGLEPGTALDLGCGQGADAIWLAQRGWAVTATDISASALQTARRHAVQAGVDDRITWDRRNLAQSVPSGPFDLVATTFLHAPVVLPRAEILRAAAETVNPGGTLLVIGHAPSPEHHHVDLPTPEQLIDELALPADRWELRNADLRTRQHAFADEAPKTRVDSVVRFERIG